MRPLRRVLAPLSRAALPLSVGACLTLAAGPAAAQIPPTRTSSESSLAPMPTPPAVRSTPPDVTATGSAELHSPPAPPTTPQGSAPPSPAGMPSPGGLPNVDTAPQRPQGTAEVAADASPPRAPGDRYGVAASKPRGWGEGTTLLTRDARVGVYVAPTFKLTGINRQPSLMLGAELAVLIAERFSVGAAGSALATPLPALRNDGRTFNMRVQYAGLTLGVALVRVKFFSLGVGALLGGGRACLNDERLDRCVNRAAMFVAEPELGLSFAVTKVLRVVLSGGYRFAVVQAWSGPSDRLLGGFSGTLALRLGRF